MKSFCLSAAVFSLAFLPAWGSPVDQSFSGSADTTTTGSAAASGPLRDATSTALPFSTVSGSATSSVSLTSNSMSNNSPGNNGFGYFNTTYVTSATAFPFPTSASMSGDSQGYNPSQYNDPTNATSATGSLLPTQSLPMDNSIPTPGLSSTNVTCDDFNTLTASQQWDAVKGDDAVTKFLDMYNSNKLVCKECFGKSKGDCQSKNVGCQNGIKDLATLNGTQEPSWTTAAAHFAQDSDDTDLTCAIGPGTCSGSPRCETCKTGPASFALLKSLTTAHNSFEANYEALDAAGAACLAQMKHFPQVFAPVPDSSAGIMTIIVFTSLVGGLAGLIPGIGGALAGMATGLGTGIGLEKYFSALPTSPDDAGPLGMILGASKKAYADMANTLFQTGTYTHATSDGRANVTISLQDHMSGGQLMQQDGDPKNYFINLQSAYEKLLYQQLALVTWQNLEVDGYTHTPFIAFDTGACSDVDPKKTTSVGNYYLPGVEKLDVQFDFQGNCYYLLDAIPTYNNEEIVSGPRCNGAHALPGGTHTSMANNSQTFANLTIQDFIIPSVLGWQNHSKTNGYATAASNGNIVNDLQAPGVVNIPVCDILAGLADHGVGCPKIGFDTHKNKVCELVSANEGMEPPGLYQPGKCRVHVEQWQRNEMTNGANVLNNFQLAIDIFDNANHEIASATKESAIKPLEVVNSELPYDLIVATGTGDNDPLSFWYADQFWLSSTANAKQCQVGSYDSGSRKLDCTFDCPLPPDSPPVSATSAHPLPTGPVVAIGGPTTFINTYTRPSPIGATAAQPTPTYAGGTCVVLVKQYQKHEEGENPTGDYQIEASVTDSRGAPIDGAASGKVAAPSGKPVPLIGMKGPFAVTALGLDADPLIFTYNDQTFNSSKGRKEPCAVDNFNNGNRNVGCKFAC